MYEQELKALNNGKQFVEMFNYGEIDLTKNNGSTRNKNAFKMRSNSQLVGKDDYNVAAQASHDWVDPQLTQPRRGMRKIQA